MKKTFAFLCEPASYTLDRNRIVYDPLGVNYCYLHGQSEARIDNGNNNHPSIEKFTIWERVKYIRRLLTNKDIIIFNGYSSFDFIALFLLNIWYRKKIGIDSDTQYSEPYNSIKRLVKRLYLRIVFGCPHVHGLAGGNYTHKELFRKFGMSENRIWLMPMMVNNDKFKDETYRQKPILPFRFLYVGRLIECKNINFMIESFCKFRLNHPLTELQIVGKGELLETLKDKYRDCEGVIFLGPKYGEDLKQVYHNCNVLILPSTYEPWGLVVNEAMAAGLPVLVSSEVGARYDLVDNHSTGFIFDPRDQQSLCQAMEKISEPYVYRRYSDNAYKMMHDYWNYTLYRDCLNQFINS